MCLQVLTQDPRGTVYAVKNYYCIPTNRCAVHVTRSTNTLDAHREARQELLVHINRCKIHLSTMTCHATFVSIPRLLLDNVTGICKQNLEDVFWQPLTQEGKDMSIHTNHKNWRCCHSWFCTAGELVRQRPPILQLMHYTFMSEIADAAVKPYQASLFKRKKGCVHVTPSAECSRNHTCTVYQGRA